MRRWEMAPAVLAAVLAAILLAAAVSFGGGLDARLAYLGGQEAWRSGHPESVFTWISTPFLAAVVALASRVVSMDVYASAFNLLNVGVAVALVATTWWRLRPTLERRLWWGTLLAAIVFAPLSSTLWWKQLNLPALGLAIAGWELLRRRRDLGGSALVALSLSLKPVLILLPLALLLKKDSRRAGVLVVAWTAGFQALAQGFLAWRAGSLAALNPLPALANFSAKSQYENWACNVQNFSPTSTICRLFGGAQLWPLQRAVALAFVTGVALLAWWALGDRPGRSWHAFALAAAVSPMLSPVAWTHYQLLLAPLFLLVAVDLPADRRALPLWVLLAVAYLMAEISWTPIGTVADVGTRFGLLPATDLRAYGVLLTLASFAQYFLLAAAIRAFAGALGSPAPLRAPIGGELPA